MTCENELCVYNSNSKCALDEVGIDSLGMCDSCIMVELEEAFLESEKERQLRRIDERW